MSNEKTIRYITDSYYFDAENKNELNLRKVVIVTAKSIGANCSDYYAELIGTINKNIETKKSGKLPKSKKEKELLIESIVNWIFDNSSCEDLFTLFLDKNTINRETCTKFCHHDDTCCWDLNLTVNEFKNLQKQLKQNNLPTDIFYDSLKTICIDKDVGLIGKIFRKLGFECENTDYYSPKQWEITNKKGENQ